MTTIRTLEELGALYDAPVPTSITKEIDQLTELHSAYIEASPFVVVASCGPGGLDCSPRGDPAGFVRVVDERTLHLPDRRGNNRLDTLRNLVVDPRIGLLFLIPGVGVTLRVNGTAVLSTDLALRESFGWASCRRRCSSRRPRCTRSAESLDPIPPLGSQPPSRGASELPSVGDIMELITAGASSMARNTTLRTPNGCVKPSTDP
jgi:predicted pyridoxine 5'-phosphate oxidase superfamily flavin-nucleotide-binding protein